MPLPSANCSIVIGGAFDPRWSEYVEEAAQQVVVEAGIVKTTTLQAHPADLPAFIGLLNLFVDFHIPVIACEFQRSEPTETTVDASL